MNNKALLGFFVVLFLILVGLYTFRSKLSFSPFRLFKNTSAQNTPTPTEQNPVAGQQPETGMSGAARISCTPEMFTQDCASVEQVPVCGYERIVSPDGTAIIRSIDYISACHYCKLYAPDNKLEMGDETVYPLGYEAGSCTAQ